MSTLNIARAVSPIGIDIGSHWVRAAQLSRAAGAARWSLHAVARIPRTPDSSLHDEATRLAGVLERRGFIGTRAVAAVPPQKLLTAVLELPPISSGAPVARLAAAELGRMHKVDPNAIEVVLWEVPAKARSAGGCEYMVAGCAHDAANEILDPFEDAGLSVRALDLPQLALLRACSSLIRPAPSMDALLQVGWGRCTLLILADGVIAYERALEGGEGRALVTTAAARLGADPRALEDLVLSPDPAGSGDDGRRELASEVRSAVTTHVAALVEQVNTSFSYVSRRYPDRDLGRVFLTGEFGGIPGLAERLATLGVDAQVVRAPDAVHANPDTADPASHGPSVVAAIGLAMHTERAAA